MGQALISKPPGGGVDRTWSCPACRGPGRGVGHTPVSGCVALLPNRANPRSRPFVEKGTGPGCALPTALGVYCDCPLRRNRLIIPQIFRDYKVFCARTHERVERLFREGTFRPLPGDHFIQFDPFPSTARRQGREADWGIPFRQARGKGEGVLCVRRAAPPQHGKTRFTKTPS